jgi:hypothetical protein
MATSKGSGGFTNEQLDDIKRRREELLERIRNVDPDKLFGLSLTTDVPASEIVTEDFHNYWFKAGGGFAERWGKARPQLQEESK